MLIYIYIIYILLLLFKHYMYIIKLLRNFSCLQVRLLLLRSKVQFVFLPIVVVVGRVQLS